MRQLIGSRRTEGRIGEQPKAVDFDQRGGAADQGDPRSAHDRLHCLMVCGRDAAAGRVTR
jgi:hypothetical protein